MRERKTPPKQNTGRADDVLNWLSQVFAVTAFNLRTIPGAEGAAFSAAAGIAGVVACWWACCRLPKKDSRPQ